MNLFGASQVRARSRRRHSRSQIAYIKNSGTAVYRGRSFDSPIIAYLNEGQKVRISLKPYGGSDGFGLFYRIVVNRRIKGFIPDTDVTTTVTSDMKEELEQKKNKRSQTRHHHKKNEEPLKPMYFSSFIGANFASVNYTEVISGLKMSSAVPMYGLKITGPSSFLADAPLDTDVLFSPSPPSYYDLRLATQPSSGFLGLVSSSLKVPLISQNRFLVFYSLGLVASFLKVNLLINQQAFDAQQVELGAVFALGVAARLTRKLSLQADIKYYYEASQYTGVLASLAYEM